MSKEKKPFEVLMIDDDKIYAETLQTYFRPHRILIKHVSNLESAKSIIASKERTIVAIILDCICLKDEKQEIADPSFLASAIKFFDQNYQNIPKLILTGEPGQKKSLTDYYKDTLNVFGKNSGEEDVAKFIIDNAKSSDYFLICKDHPELICLFDENVLDEATWIRFVSIYKKLNQNDIGMIEDNLSKIRKIQEEIYKQINMFNPQLIETKNIENNVMVNEINRNFVDKGIMTQNKDILNQFVWSIYNITSNFGSHTQQGNFQPLTKPTKYTVISLFNALCDLMLWLDTIVKEKNSK